MKKVILSLMMIAAIALFSGSAFAATTTGSLNVSATIVEVCSVEAYTLYFGSYTGADVLSSQNMYVTCTSGTQYRVALDAGFHFFSSFRRIAVGTNYLQYFLYKDSGRSIQWGDSDTANTYPAGSSVLGAGNGSQQNLVVYGKLVGGVSHPAPGDYYDYVTVTVNY